MREGDQQPPDRKIVVKPVTEQTLLWVKQLSRARAMGEQVHDAVQALRPGERATLWTRSEAAAPPVYLRADPYAVFGIGRIIRSRVQDLEDAGLGDVALAVLDGADMTPATDTDGSGADVTRRPRPEVPDATKIRY